MKILHIMGSDVSSGAGRGAYWLHKGLLSIGVDSIILTNSKNTLDDPTIVSSSKTNSDKIADVFRAQLDIFPSHFYKAKKAKLDTGLIGYNFTQHPLFDWADIIHLHWINGGFVNMRHLATINKPIVWTIRDMWPMTGGCHYSMDCENFKSRCGACPELGSSFKYDLSRFVAWNKHQSIPKNTRIVGISSWITECALESSLFQNFEVCTISNAIDTKAFFPVDKRSARIMLGLPEDGYIVLVGAHDLNAFYKGFQEFMESLEIIKTPIFVAAFGKLNMRSIAPINLPHKFFGFLYDEISLRLLYSAANVFVAPSKMDAFGKTIAESMACGTPVVAFNATGPKDIIDHLLNGYLATPFDSNDLAHGIDWILNYQNPQSLAFKARQKILNNFEMTVVAQKYKAHYKELMGSVR